MRSFYGDIKLHSNPLDTENTLVTTVLRLISMAKVFDKNAEYWYLGNLPE